MDSYLIAQKVYLALSHVRLSFQLDQLLCIPSRDSLRLSRREYHVLWYHLSNSLSRLAFYTEILFAGVSAVSFQTASFRSQLQLKFPRAHIFVFKIFVVIVIVVINIIIVVIAFCIKRHRCYTFLIPIRAVISTVTCSYIIQQTNVIVRVYDTNCAQKILVYIFFTREHHLFLVW